MAFIKRTWLARLGTGLNKFLIGDKGADGKQTLTNSPDTVVQEGDVISADNLNDLEDRISDGFSSMKLTKIWENPAPSEEFGNQNVSVGTYRGDFVIAYKWINSNDGPINYFFCKFNGASYNGFNMGNASASTIAMLIISRTVSFQTVGNEGFIHFENCVRTEYTADGLSGAARNNLMIPVAIYKGGDIYNS